MTGIIFLALWLAIAATSGYALFLGVKYGNELVEEREV